MTLTEFQQLDDAIKAEIAIEGNFITERFHEGLTVALYSNPQFYVELYYDPAKNEIASIKCFDQIKHLAPYLAHLKVHKGGR